MKIKKLLVLAIFAIAIVGIIAPTNATNLDKNVKIESKEKSANYKITWNGNGGKIGTKKVVSTDVKTDKKIGKLPTTPKRSGYTFKGWYTKKTGGTKITKNTVVKKKVTFYAIWKKGTSVPNTNRVLTAEEKKLLGTHRYTLGSDYWLVNYYDFSGSSSYLTSSNVVTTYYFYADGTYKMFRVSLGNFYGVRNYDGRIWESGKWAVTSPNTISLSNTLQNWTILSPSTMKSQSYMNKAMTNNKLYYVESIPGSDKKGYYFNDYGTLKDLKEKAASSSAYNFYKTM